MRKEKQPGTMSNQIFTTKEIQKIYNGLASSYDFSLFFFKMMGFRVQTYRKNAVENLHLNTGDKVVDLGCGTGLNFSILHDQVGPSGKIIGVDLSDEMLAKAQQRSKKRGWENVELVQCDMAEFQIPPHTDGVLSTLAISMSPDYDSVIKGISRSLRKGKRMSIFELQNPEKWPRWLVKAMIFSLKSYGTRYEHTQRTPCNSIDKYFSDVSVLQYYFGSVCIASGESE